MIERYSRPEMHNIWNQQNKFKIWLDIELAACDAHVIQGNLKKDDVDEIKERASFDVSRIDEIESEIHHDVIAFLTNVAEYVGDKSRFIHLGLTSSDIVDTGFSIQLKQAGNILMEGLNSLMWSIKKQAIEHKYTLMMGRTHGVHAEPTTFGLKCTVWYEEMKRNKKRLQEAISMCNVGKMSGAVGNYAHISPELEKNVCQKLGLEPALISTQILQRDRHAHFMTTIAIIAGTLEKIAVEIRSLQKTEFNELQEPFSKTQKGSSAMPHKRNPIISERVTGLARVIRGYAITAMENQALWHERDISHSSAERIIFPDGTIALDYMLFKMKGIIDGLIVNKDQMKKNINKSFHVFYSQRLLLKLIDKGMSREEAYRLVQKNTHESFDHKVNLDVHINYYAEGGEIRNLLNESELNDVFNINYYIEQVDTIYKRVYSFLTIESALHS